MAVVPIGPPVVRPGSYRDPLYRYRGVAPIGPAIPVLPYPPAPAIVLAPPVVAGPGIGGVEINTPGFRLSIPGPVPYAVEPAYAAESAYPSDPVISSYPPMPGPAFDVATQLTEGVERLAASLNTIEDGDIWWDYLQIDALRQVTDNSKVTSDGSMTADAAATIDSAARAYRGVTSNGQLGNITRLDGFAETRDALVVLSQSQSILSESANAPVASPLQPTSAMTNEPTLAPAPEEANDSDVSETDEEADRSIEGSVEELPAPPKIKI
ncbi:hypothetical protein [Rhodopirellula baltica]|uniref:Uncharacterized protein n=1 Tax=Rhodopirellula baltica WH47 TaxID=991778 RepID=F2ATB5_RHOBT|nr:hypothetical protein [Rhodopirellula baltica]EGF27092.1 hypothetical protein RBWH47_00276 [Rhodopirellula baltica WH47]